MTLTLQTSSGSTSNGHLIFKSGSVLRSYPFAAERGIACRTDLLLSEAPFFSSRDDRCCRRGSCRWEHEPLFFWFAASKRLLFEIFPGRWGHKLRTGRILNRVVEDTINLREIVVGERPAADIVDGIELIGRASAP